MSAYKEVTLHQDITLNPTLIPTMPFMLSYLYLFLNGGNDATKNGQPLSRSVPRLIICTK